MIPVCKSYYGGYRTRKFTDIFPNVDVFVKEYREAQIPQRFINESMVTTLYYLLYSRYGNSHIASSDENQFKYALMTTIFMYGPAWEKKLDVQDILRKMSEEDLIKGGKAIYNHAYNPGTAPGTSTLEELPAINEQNTNNYKKSKLEGYSMLLSVLEDDVTETFLSKFKKLFISVLAPDYPLLYVTEGEN